MKNWSKWRRNNFLFFHDHIGSLRNKIVVDLGAGEQQFRSIFLQAMKYIPVDFHEYPGIEVVADITKPLPFSSEYADVVVLSNTLEHVPAPEALLAEAYRITAHGGMIIGTVPFLRDVHQAPYDFLRYTNYMLEKILHGAGYEKILIRPLGTPLDVFILMQNTFFGKLPLSVPVRIARKIFSLATKMLKPLMDRGEPTSDFTEGYGFIAFKNTHPAAMQL